MEEKLESKDTALLVHIEHSKPIEVCDFIKTLNAISGLFADYVRRNGECAEMAKAKLYVEKIEHGCIDIHLCEMVSSSIIPFMENANVIMEFAGYIKKIVGFYAKGIGDKPSLSIKELKEVHDLFSVTARDRGGKASIGAIRKADKINVFNNCTFNAYDGNAAQNQARVEADERDGDCGNERVYKRQLMKIYQMRSDLASDTGNKAIVDAISAKRINLCFESEKLKMTILNSDNNPIKKIFLVDVVVQTVNGNIAAYKVTALHDIMDYEE